MTNWSPITESEFRQLMAENVLRLDADMFPLWEELGVMPVQISCERARADGGRPSLDPMFVVARSEEDVLIYDDVEEEFGIGRLDSDGVLRNWGTYGEELSWTLRRFLPGHSKPTA